MLEEIDSMAACIITTKNSSFYGSFKKCRYMSHIMAVFWIAHIYEIYCNEPLDRRNRYSLLRRNTLGLDLLDLSTVMVDLIIFSFLLSTSLETWVVTKIKKINIGRSYILVEYCLDAPCGHRRNCMHVCDDFFFVFFFSFRFGSIWFDSGRYSPIRSESQNKPQIGLI